MQLHINEFDSSGQITAAYTADSENFELLGLWRPVAWDGGNAILFGQIDHHGHEVSGHEMVISAPRPEGDVTEIFGRPAVVRDLKAYFGWPADEPARPVPLTDEDYEIYRARVPTVASCVYMQADERDSLVMLAAMDPDRALARGLTYQRGIGIMDPSNPACWEPVEIDRCWYRDGTPKPCSRHAAEARAAADAAEAAYRENRAHMPAQDVATGAQGARAYAWRRALERPLTPCADGAKGLGWPGEDL